MHLQETILCATAPPSSAAGPGSISIHDIQTGSSLASFKQTSARPHCTSLVKTKDAQGGFMLSSQLDKSVLHVYNFQKDQIALKIILPEKLTCIAVDHRGDYCAGGTSQGRIYLWEIASGVLYNTWDAHYREVSVLKFTNDGAALLSGSEDSGVSVWSVSRLLDNDSQNELPVPYCTLSDHTLQITDIVCGVGPFPTCRVLTSSVDHSVKLWDLSSRTLLTTFAFPQPVTCLAWDVTERMFFAASANGSIHQMNLFRQREDKAGSQVVEAIGGAGVTDIIRIGIPDSQVKTKRLISVEDPVTAITISLTSSLLLVGTSNGLIHVYDVPSHQLLRTISTHKGLSITHLATMLKPPDLVGHISLHLNVGSLSDAKDIIPVKPVAPFQRTRDAKAREAHDVAILLPVQSSKHSYQSGAYSDEELIRDHGFFVQPQMPTNSSAAVDTGALTSKVSELEAEIARLQGQLGKAKGVNDAMWETVVQRMVGNKSSKAKDDVPKYANMDADEGGGRRKRGRT